MSASPNRSPSPAAFRRNPNGRNTDSGNSIRKSFGGFPSTKPSVVAPKGFNPVTPANSPSDLHFRNSGIRASYEKENERDHNSLNLGKAKSPGTAKGTKSFMAPTISAASKVKKVLTEKNETVRASASPFPATSSQESEIKQSRSMLGVNLVDSNVVSDASVYPQLLQRSRAAESCSYFSVLNPPEFSVTDDLSVSNVSKILDFSSKPMTTDFKPNLGGRIESNAEMSVGDSRKNILTPKSTEAQNTQSLPVSFSPDIHPTLPPYDPERNFLSPRPRFLRYKPNPRIKAYIHKEKNGLENLEDSFTSESSSETETTEETQSPNSIPSEINEENDNFLSRQDKSNFHHNPQRSFHSSKRPKLFLSFLLILAIFCVSVSVTDSPVIMSFSSLSKFNCSSFSQTHGPRLMVLADRYLRGSLSLAKFASEHFERVSGNVGAWSSNSFSYLVRQVFAPREVKIGMFALTNLTVPITDNILKELTDKENQMGFIDTSQGLEMDLKTEEHGEEEAEEEAEERGEEEEEEEAEESFIESKSVDETLNLSDSEEGDDKKSIEEAEQGFIESKSVDEKLNLSDSEEGENKNSIEEAENEAEKLSYSEPERFEKATELVDLDSDHEEDAHKEENFEPMEIKSKESEDQCIKHLMYGDEIVEAEELVGEGDSISQSDSDPDPPSDPGFEVLKAQGLIDAAIRFFKDNFTAPLFLGVSSTLLALFVSAAYAYLKKKKVSGPRADIPRQPLSPKKESISDSNFVSNCSDPKVEETKNSMAEVEMACESGPFDVSRSSATTMSSSEKVDDSMSQGKRPRKVAKRKSVAAAASASAVSPSYGSFSTYEVLHKGMVGDDEAMTPVRRSSRLRKQITSP